MCCYKYYLINFLLRFSLHVFAAFLELSTTPEVNVAKKSTIELGYEIYQLRSAQCRNQGKILKCDFHVHEYNFLFFAKCTTVCFFFLKNQVPYTFAYIGLNFHQIVYWVVLANSSTKCKNVALFWEFFFHLPLDIQYLWGKHIDINRTFSPSVKFCFYHQITVWQEERMSVKCLQIRKPQMDFPTLWTLSEKNTSLMNT